MTQMAGMGQASVLKNIGPAPPEYANGPNGIPVITPTAWATPPATAMIVAASITFCPANWRDMEVSVAKAAVMTSNAVGHPDFPNAVERRNICANTATKHSNAINDAERANQSNNVADGRGALLRLDVMSELISVEAEAKHFFYEAKLKNGHDDGRCNWLKQLCSRFPNDFEDEGENEDEEEPTVGLALKLFNEVSLR